MADVRDGLKSRFSPETLRKVREYLNHPNLVYEPDYEDPSAGKKRPQKIWDLDSAEELDQRITNRQAPTASSTQQDIPRLPEALIWHTLISLLKVAHYLHTGGRSSKEERGRRSWQPVVHNLINPTNIFLLDPDIKGVTGGPIYGNCVLGNFSRSVVLARIATFGNGDTEDEEKDDARQAFARVAAFGERTGYEAPELVGELVSYPCPASDLWSIGAVMVRLMTGSTVWDVILERDFILKARKGKARGKTPRNWSEASFIKRQALLMEFTGNDEMSLALPWCYAESLRMIVESLLVSDPMDRGNAVDALRDAESMYEIRKAEVGVAVLEGKANPR